MQYARVLVMATLVVALSGCTAAGATDDHDVASGSYFTPAEDPASDPTPSPTGTSPSTPGPSEPAGPTGSGGGGSGGGSGPGGSSSGGSSSGGSGSGAVSPPSGGIPLPPVAPPPPDSYPEIGSAWGWGNNPTCSPDYVRLTDVYITFTVEAYDDYGVSAVYLYYGGMASGNMALDQVSGTTWSGTIYVAPGTDGNVIWSNIQAVDSSGQGSDFYEPTGVVVTCQITG